MEPEGSLQVIALHVSRVHITALHLLSPTLILRVHLRLGPASCLLHVALSCSCALTVVATSIRVSAANIALLSLFHLTSSVREVQTATVV
jgi:hypothetical protein